MVATVRAAEEIRKAEKSVRRLSLQCHLGPPTPVVGPNVMARNVKK